MPRATVSRNSRLRAVRRSMALLRFTSMTETNSKRSTAFPSSQHPLATLRRARASQRISRTGELEFSGYQAKGPLQ